MNLHEHFLPRDLEQASKEYKCVKELMQKIQDYVAKGKVDQAMELSTSLTLSLHELSNLAFHRRKLERHKRLLGLLPVQAHIEIVRGIKHD